MTLLLTQLILAPTALKAQTQAGRLKRLKVNATCPAGTQKQVRTLEGGETIDSFVKCVDNRGFTLKRAHLRAKLYKKKRLEEELIAVTEHASLRGELRDFYQRIYERQSEEVKAYMTHRRDSDLELTWELKERRLTASVPGKNYNHTVVTYPRRRFESHGFSYAGFGTTYGKTSNGIEFRITTKLKNVTGLGGYNTVETCGTTSGSAFKLTLDSVPGKPAFVRARLEHKNEIVFDTELENYDRGDDLYAFLEAYRNDARFKAWEQCRKLAEKMIENPASLQFGFIDPNETREVLESLED